VDNADTTQTTTGQTTGRIIPGQSVTAQAVQGQNNGTQMPGFQQVQQQVVALRQTLQTLMMEKQYADGEIVTASAALDAQLEDYYRTLSDKKQPGMRTF
jgi:hypothetical protein